MSRWEFLFPLPPQGLNPNGPQHRGGGWATTKARRSYRDECAVVILGSDRPEDPLERARVTATALICRRSLPTRVSRTLTIEQFNAIGRYRPQDEPNLTYALKPLFDALVREFVLRDDDRWHMVLEQPRIADVDSFGAEGVRVIVEALEADGPPPGSRRGMRLGHG